MLLSAGRVKHKGRRRVRDDPEAARPKTRPSDTPREASINADRHNIWYGRRSLLL